MFLLSVNRLAMVESGRRASVSVAGDGIEIGRLQIHMDGKRTSHIKNTILEAKFDEASTIEQTGSKFHKNYFAKITVIPIHSLPLRNLFPVNTNFKKSLRQIA